MKKILVLIMGIFMTMMFCACSNREVVNNEAKSVNNQEENLNNEDKMDKNIEIVIGSKKFTATLEDNDTARYFQSLLPLTINMGDVNNNEKAYSFSQSIRKEKSKNPGSVNKGDIMCWSDNVLVLFYDSFTTPYKYVKIGSVDDTRGFVEVLGSGSVEVTIK